MASDPIVPRLISRGPIEAPLASLLADRGNIVPRLISRGPIEARLASLGAGSSGKFRD